MTDICVAVNKYLTNYAEIKSQIQDRLYPELLPENAPLPSIVYTPISANYDSALDGDTGFVRQTIQFVCHASTFGKARQLSRLVKKALQNYKGNMYGVNIQAIFIKADYTYNGNTSLKFNPEEYMASIEFEIFFNEN